MALLGETNIHISGERARRLSELAAARGTTEASIVEEALDSLFRQCDSYEYEEDDLTLLKSLEAENGPLPPIQTTPSIDPEEIVSAIPVYVPSNSPVHADESH